MTVEAILAIALVAFLLALAIMSWSLLQTCLEHMALAVLVLILGSFVLVAASSVLLFCAFRAVLLGIADGWRRAWAGRSIDEPR